MKFFSITFKVFILLFLILFISFSYLLIVISDEEQSLPFITKYIESHIQKKLKKDNSISIKDISIEYHKFNIVAKIKDLSFKKESIEINIPDVKLKFFIFDLLLLKKYPEEIKSKEVNIIYNVVNGDNNINKFSKNIVSSIINNNFYSIIIDKLNIQLTKNKISKNITIENFFLNKNKLLLKKNMSFFAFIKLKDQNIKTESNCYIKKTFPVCKFSLSKIDFEKITNSYQDLDQNLSFLPKIKSKIDVNITIKDNEIYFDTILTKNTINDGRLFLQKILFNKLQINGKYYFENNHLEIKDFQLDLDEKTQISGSKNIIIPKLGKYDINLSIKNINRDKIFTLWPNFIKKDDKIKLWISKYIKNINIYNSKLSIEINNNKLQNINAKFLFTDAAIIYDRKFPPIYKMSGEAFFDKKSMNISINSGQFLNSKIKKSNIKINNFFEEMPELNISGQINGVSEDLLKYINYKSKFAKNISNYLNGFATSFFNVSIPLKNNLSLSDIYLDLRSNIRKFNSEYIKNNSNIDIKINKLPNSSSFSTFLDLTKSDINFWPLAIKKPKFVKSYLKTNINIKDDIVEFNEIDYIYGKNFLKGVALFDTKTSSITNLNLINKDVNLSYVIYPDQSKRKISLIGKYFDFSKFLSHNILSQNDNISIKENNQYKINDVEVILEKIKMKNNIIFHDLDVSLHCNQSVCINSFVNLKDNNQKELVNIDFKPYPIKKKTKITGKIHDISNLAKSFNVNHILSGDLIVRGEIEMDNNDAIIKGEAYNKKDYKILKGKFVKKISEDKNLFEKIKNKISLGNEIIFSDLDIIFTIKDAILQLKKFVISNNYLGITARGDINLLDGGFDIKGLIVPGYLVNRLFGIGELPVIKYIIPILTGESGGGIFASTYEAKKDPRIDTEIRLEIDKGSILVPGPIRNIFH